jgi:outer membrane murein-binding lipoprotein Lpp
MDTTLLIAIVTGLCTAVPSIVATFVMNNAREAVQGERMNNMSTKIDELNVKVDKLADFDKRISLLEQNMERIINDMKGEHYHE